MYMYMYMHEHCIAPFVTINLMFFPCTVVYAWFNPIGYNVSEDAGVATLMIQRIGANGIPVNISITTQDINATGMVN